MPFIPHQNQDQYKDIAQKAIANNQKEKEGLIKTCYKFSSFTDFQVLTENFKNYISLQP